MRVLVAGVQVPFVRGGAELLIESLQCELERRGHEVAAVRLPFKWYPHRHLLESCLAWRLLDLDRIAGRPVDAVIATRFPSYCLRHPRKTVWLVHQHRQAHDLLATPFTDFGFRVEDLAALPAIYKMDEECLGEARFLAAISANVAGRLAASTGLTARVLYPPPFLASRLGPGPYSGEILYVGRLEANKRPELLLQALARTRRPVRAVLAGSGPGRPALEELAAGLGVADRVRFAGYVPDADLPGLYAGCRAVFYAPYDEDYGYVTVEAMMAAKPVVTCTDSGGVLEFVRPGLTGLAAAPEPAALAAALDELWEDEAAASRLGLAGREQVAAIGWDAVIPALLGEAGR